MNLDFFEVKSVNFYFNDSGMVCFNCKTFIKSHPTILNPCQHVICTNCLDLLADNYIPRNNEDLFECSCGKKIIDIEYK